MNLKRSKTITKDIRQRVNAVLGHTDWKFDSLFRTHWTGNPADKVCYVWVFENNASTETEVFLNL